MKLSRKKILSGLILVWCLSLMVYFLMPKLEESLLDRTPRIKSYEETVETSQDSIGNKIIWIITDLSEGTVHRSLFASVGLITGGFIAHYLWKNNSKYMGNPISGGSGYFPWIVLAITIGISTANIAYGGFRDLGFPTYLPGCTIASALIMSYGGNLTVALTGGVVSALIQVPLGYLGLQIAGKLGLPGVVGSVIFGMSISGVLVFEIVKILPWMKSIVLESERKEEAGEEVIEVEDSQELPASVGTGAFWLVRRSFADLTEIYFFGNEIAGLGLILGLLFSWFLNPLHTGYGNVGLTSSIIAGQLMASSLAIFIHYDKWQKLGWYNTFTVAVAMGTLILTFGDSLKVMLIAVVLSAFICPYLAAKIDSKIDRYPPIVGGTCGMAVGIAIVGIVLRLIV